MRGVKLPRAKQMSRRKILLRASRLHHPDIHLHIMRQVTHVVRRDSFKFEDVRCDGEHGDLFFVITANRSVLQASLLFPEQLDFERIGQHFTCA